LGARELRAAEMVERQHGVLRPRLPQQEGGEETEAYAGIDDDIADERRARFGACEPEGDEQQADRDEAAADQVDGPAAVGRIRRDAQPEQSQRNAAQRQVDGKDQPPAPVAQRGQHQPADDRAQYGGQRRKRRPKAYGLAAFLARVGLGDDGEAARHHQGGAESLHGPGGDEEAGAGRQRAKERGENEEHDAEAEDVAQPEAVARRAADQQQRGEEQHVGIRHPLHVGERRAQVGADGRGGDRQHRAVDEAHRGGENRRDEDEDAAIGGNERGFGRGGGWGAHAAEPTPGGAGCNLFRRPCCDSSRRRPGTRRRIPPCHPAARSRRRRLRTALRIARTSPCGRTTR